jgi:type II secretory pathway pseudopilin PulG
VGGGSSNTLALVIGIAVGGVVLVAIIGMLAAIAIPNLLTAMQRSRQKRTMADIRTVGAALDAYGTDHEREEFPPGPIVSALRTHLEPTYIKSLPAKDGWTTDIRYMPLPNRGYAIVSAGADKVFQAESVEGYTPETKTQNFDCDIVFSNGQFIQYPEGLQSGGGR